MSNLLPSTLAPEGTTHDSVLAQLSRMSSYPGSDGAIAEHEMLNSTNPITGGLYGERSEKRPPNSLGEAAFGPGIPPPALTLQGIPAITPNLAKPNTVPIILPKTAAAPNDAIRQIVVDSNELLQKSAELTQVAAKVPALKQKVAELSNQKTAAEKELTDLRSNISTKVAEFAEKLVRHGSLSETKKVAFVQTIAGDPTQIVDVMERLSTLSSSHQFGAGDTEKTGADAKGPDPIAAFCGLG